MLRKIKGILVGVTTLAASFWTSSAFATAPTSLADALEVTIDNTAIWTSMAIVMSVVAMFFVFRRVKGIFR